MPQFHQHQNNSFSFQPNGSQLFCVSLPLFLASPRGEEMEDQSPCPRLGRGAAALTGHLGSVIFKRCLQGRGQQEEQELRGTKTVCPALALATRALDPPSTPRPPGQSPRRLGACHNGAWCLSPSPPPPDSPGEVTPKQCRGPPRRGGSLPSFTPPTVCPGESVYVPQFVGEFLGAQRRWFVPGSHRQLEMKSPLNPGPPSKGGIQAQQKAASGQVVVGRGHGSPAQKAPPRTWYPW